MGLEKTYNDLKSPTAGKLGIWQQYDRALDTLACRCIGEPYNFYRVCADILAPMLGDTFHGKVIATCKDLLQSDGRYTAHTVAGKMNLPTETITALGQKDSEIDLPLALEFFRDIYGQFIEIQIADFVTGWVMQGKTSEEIQILSANYRSEKGVRARQAGSDGVADFEAKLFAALDGKVYEHPIKPHLAKMRELTPDYPPGCYIVVAALSGVGKSYYGLNTMYHNAVHGAPSCYINLEMTPSDVQKRLWQMCAGETFRRDLRSNDDVTRARLAAWERVKEMGIKSHNPGRSLHSILSTIRYEWNERGIQFALVDYAQLVNIPGYRGARNYELGEVSAELRSLALELKIPVMVLAQLKQEVVKTASKRGGLYDIKDCANFAQDAEFVHILHRPNEHLSEGEISEFDDDYADVTNVKGRETGRLMATCKFNHVLGFYDTEPVSFQFPAAAPISTALPTGFKPTEDIPF